MGTILASTIIGKAQAIVQDSTGVRWPTTELLGWLNDGQKHVSILKPSVYVINGNVSLVAGTKQSIPAGGTMLVDVVRNMGEDGTVPGKSVRMLERSVLDEQNPDWHTSDPSSVVSYVMYDARDEKTFYVYPPQPESGMGRIEIVYPVAPPDMALVSNAISLDDIYEGVLIDYCLYRAYLKDAEYAGNDGRSAQHYKKVTDTLGLQKMADDESRVTTRKK